MLDKASGAVRPAYGDRLMLVGSSLCESRSRRWIDSLNPADESVLCRVPAGNAQDIDDAVDAAREAQREWAMVSPAVRSEYFHRLADALLARQDEILEAEVRDTGNTIGAMRNDVVNAAGKLRFFAGLSYEAKGATIPSTPGNLHYTVFEPYGVVGRLFAFNHPLSMAVGAITAPLIAGNAVVEKPSEQSPLTACLFAEIVREVLPAGLVNIVTGYGSEAGDALVRHRHVKRLAFVGSVPTGMRIQRTAAEVGVKNVTLELGGKNAMLVFPDVDYAKAVNAAVGGMNFSWQGQSCASTSRLFVHESMYDAFVEDVGAKVAQIKVGDPMDPSSQMGPLNFAAHYDRVREFIASARDEGARLVTGGKRPAGQAFEKGYWIEPTVFADVKPDMRIAREEIFGPVLSIFKWSDLDETIDLINSVDYGLTGAVWTNNLSLAHKTARRLQAGYIWINGVSARYRGVPYGGYKNSGTGRDSGSDEILSYMEEKAVNVICD